LRYTATGAFGCIPETLSEDVLFPHIHPFAPPGKTMLQLIDRDGTLRIDVFRTCGVTMQRAVEMDLPFGRMQIVSLEDLVAIAARLLLDLAEGLPVASKHARDYLRFAELAGPEGMEAAWRDHRKPMHPMTFRETNTVLENLIPGHAGLLIAPQYSRDTSVVCPQCAATGAFELAGPKLVVSLLGYC
jgi:hypothetical protein